jgi:two-component system response regulator YesN
MYRILLIDDEPLLLSGLKRIVNWKENDCETPELASNGEEAMEKITRLQPQIIICDIAMPGMSGLDILEKVNADFPGIVCIMLTNHEDFSLARESLRSRAVDYILKNNLDTETMEDALDRAKQEWENRNKLRRVDEAAEFLRTEKKWTSLREAVSRFLQTTKSFSAEDEAFLEREGLMSRFAFAFIPFNYTLLPDYPEISPEERRRLFDWETEIVERLGASFFQKKILLPREGTGTEGLLLFVWGITHMDWQRDAERFRERLIKTSGQITQVVVDLYVSPFCENRADAGKPFLTLARMDKQYLIEHRGKCSDAPRKAKQYILDNVEKKITLTEAAKFAAISPGYLSTLFRREFGQNMVDFINKTKINRACEILLESRYRINEVADKLGFDNAFYFTRVFRKYTGISPTEFVLRRTKGGG